MKKSILLFSLMFLLCSCAPLQDDNVEWYEERIYNWIDKESECLNNPEYIFDPAFEIDINSLAKAFYDAKQEITICIDPAIEWKSSCEIEQIREGDCDTLGIWLWRKLRARGWPDNVNGMMIVYLNEFDSFHVVNAIKYNDDFIIADMMQILPSFTFLSEIKQSFEPIVWFNLFEIELF